MVLGIQRDGFPIIMPDINTLITKDDILWVMGSNNNVGALMADSLEDGESTACGCGNELKDDINRLTYKRVSQNHYDSRYPLCMLSFTL